ncbi:acidic endochitinase Pun g 14, amyloplastic-like [Silene latifolia]|uniref:acidic endochitinase Pun g 14, amyloplastic-like n=1 Tax=Silene latifolia TaxID=37657 RepID=UPI003D783C87
MSITTVNPHISISRSLQWGRNRHVLGQKTGEGTLEAGTGANYDVLAKALQGHSISQRKVFLSAAPQCPFPDAHLSPAINNGVFDFVWIQFYNNPSAACQYNGNTNQLLSSWSKWSTVNAGQVLLGIPGATSSGFIPP